MAGTGLWDDPGILWDDSAFLWDTGPVVSSGPVWAPSLVQVADYVPWRTLTRAESSILDSEDTYQATFTATTRPDGSQVGRLITNAVARVLARVGTLADTLQGAATAAAAVLAAASVERGWPEDQDALARAEALEKQGELLLAELVAANTVETGNDYGLDISPVWSFPGADSRYDDPYAW